MPEKLNATVALQMSPADFDKHRAAEVARREQFASHYPVIASAIDNAILNNLPGDVNSREVIIPTAGRNDEEDEKLAEVRKVHKRMAESRTIPATIVNLLPWEIQAQGVHLMYSDMTIPRCPIGQAFELKVIRTYKIDIEDKGGRFGADAVTPIALANDIIQQLRPQKRGGLFQYLGDHVLGENPKTRDDEMKALDRAKKEMVRYFRQLFREAEGFYQQSSRRGLVNIVEGHRLACQWLLHFRYITQVPAWLTATREEGDVPDACPSCGTEAGGGFSCGACGYIFDPAAAYQAEEIEDDHQSLRRLSREELDGLGLDYVMTKDEYRSARKKAATSGEEGDEPTPRKANRRHKPARKPAAKPEEAKE